MISPQVQFFFYGMFGLLIVVLIRLLIINLSITLTFKLLISFLMESGVLKSLIQELLQTFLNCFNVNVRWYSKVVKPSVIFFKVSFMFSYLLILD